MQIESTEKIIKFFKEICAIPHGTGNEKKLSDHIKSFACERGLWVHQDSANNLVIKKTASPGYENSPGVILQAHIDMVCEKNVSCEHDFINDPILPVICSDIIKASGTTLGADNGIAVAMIMAYLDSENEHPLIEALLTTGEESGMKGLEVLDGSLLESRMLINLDTEEEGEFFTSCAGGLKIKVMIPLEYAEIDKDWQEYILKIRGLSGGHSGMEIHKQRGNANVLMGRTLNALCNEFDISMAEINGGLMNNAIPRESEAVIAFSPDDYDRIIKRVKEIEKVFSDEFRSSESELKLSIENSVEKGKYEKRKKYFTSKVCKHIISAILLTPDGVQYMSGDIPGLVETSNNLGVIRTEESHVVLTNAIRSSVASRKYLVADRIKSLCSVIGAELAITTDYPAWEYNPVSSLREKAVEVYRELSGKEPVVTAVHAGLECGVLSEMLKGVDIISFGPDIKGAHTPEENASISSVGRVYLFMTELLKRLK